MKQTLSRLIACAGFLGLVHCAHLNAAIIFNLGEVITGDTPAGTPPPWLRATFEQGGADTVHLTMAAVNLVGKENAVKWGFNLANGVKFSDLIIGSTYISSGFDATSTKFRAEAGTVNPVKSLEFHWDFPTGQDGTTPGKVFNSGDWVKVEFSRKDGANLTPEDFLGTSAVYAETGKQYYSVAHVQNTTDTSVDGKSGKIGASTYTIPDGPGAGVVPEPSTYLGGLAGLGMLGATFLRRRE
jgi:hypothetical protein